MSDKFMAGQLIEWVTTDGNVVARGHILRKSDAQFVSYDRLVPCWVCKLDGQDQEATIAETGLKSRRLQAEEAGDE